MADALTTTYAKLLRGSYDCLDRIVMNGYYRQAHSPGGFRIWWRRLHGGEDTLDNAHLIRMAGRFRRRLRAWAAENRVPIRICNHGEQKHDVAEEYRQRTEIQEGLFLIIEGRAQAPVWDIQNGFIRRKKPYPYINHFSFHILDRDWGHITIKISGHPPFPAQIILNGHEYVERQAVKAGADVHKREELFRRLVRRQYIHGDSRDLNLGRGFRAVHRGVRPLDLQNLPTLRA